MYLLAKYGTQTAFTFPIAKAGSRDFAATGDWTPATGDTKVSKDGGNVANSTNNPSAIAGTGSVDWTLTLTATELTAAVIDVQIVDSATKAVDDQFLKIYTYGNASAKIPLDLSNANLALTQPINFTGTAGSALVKVDAVDVAGAAVSTSTAQLGVNVVNIGGTAQTTGQDVVANINTLLTRITSTLFSGITSLAHWLGEIAGKQTPNATAQTEIRATGAGSGTYDATTDSLEAFKDATATAAQVAAAVTASIQLKKNVALSSYPFTLYLAGTRTPATGKTPTCTKCLDAASVFSAMANSAAEIGSTGTYRINMTTAETNCNTGTWKFEATGCDPLIIHFITQS